MKVLTWLKDKALWVLGGVVAVLAIMFAVNYEKDKLEKLKAKTRAKLSQASEKEQTVASLEGQAQSLETAEEIIDGRITKIDKNLAKVSRGCNGSATDMADRFNAIYSRDSSPPGSPGH